MGFKESKVFWLPTTPESVIKHLAEMAIIYGERGEREKQNKVLAMGDGYAELIKQERETKTKDKSL